MDKKLTLVPTTPWLCAHCSKQTYNQLTAVCEPGQHTGPIEQQIAGGQHIAHYNTLLHEADNVKKSG
jgi:hypothetical protein